ncbi:MAG: HNH endonuclease [bacterium]
MLETFVGNCPDGKEVRHLNGIPDDNRLKNLKYGTRKENVQDSIKHGTALIGSKNGQSKLTKKEVIEIRSKYRKENITQKELGKKYGVARRTIGDIINYKCWSWVS